MPDDLLGRDDELHRVATLVRDARNGIAGALVVRGEAGIGKSALLAASTAALDGLGVVRTDGYEAESGIAYAGLHRLIGPWGTLVEGLASPYRTALRSVLGGRDGTAADRFLVGLGVLELLSAAARERPLVCVVDDVHWLDAETVAVLAFVARRLGAEAVALLMACRDDGRLDENFAGVPVLPLTGLDPAAGAQLLVASLDDGVDPLVVARVVRATGGNPLALVDLARELTTQELSESAVGEEPVPVGRHLEAHYLARVRQTSPAVQEWLLVAAAEATGTARLVSEACAGLGIDPRAADEAEELGLVALGATVRFRHPLVRSAAYGAAPGPDRRRAHRALSDAADACALPELAAWHASKATVGEDAAVADRLEAVADAAGARGGFVSRARVLGRAAELTPPGPSRDRRVVAAAEAAVAAGAAQVGATLLDGLPDARLPPVERARVTAVRVSLGLFTGDPDVLAHATSDLLAAAEQLRGIEPERERQALVRAFEYTLVAERSRRGVTLTELGRRLREGSAGSDDAAARVLRALGALVLDGTEDAVPALRRGLDALRTLEGPGVLPYASAGVALATALWDLAARTAWLDQVTQAARDAGSLQMVDTGLWISSLAELTGGTPRRAGQYVEQVRELRRAIGYDGEHVVNVAFLAWTDAPRTQVEAVAVAAGQAGYGGVESSGRAALAVRDLAQGHYRDAYVALRPLVDDPFLQVTPLQLPDFVEAAVRSGHDGEAVRHVGRVERIADATASPWARGVALRCRALVAPGTASTDLLDASAEALDEAGAVVEAARSRLLLGESLRRDRRRAEARARLRSALAFFEDAGAAAFAERARTELEATGEARGRGRAETPSLLTPREETVARLAARGETNAEIGATLFISANTVDYHLRKVFQKLGVSSRRQLRERFPDGTTV
ncbi:AAA family ATPase [Cellulosimicrobium sp. PMB13]|uniref:helix-turn-helix transcriptional regulator n=1 Tax=Cellulosimicrobium sp. PMB13 TaxID=3120158 RepID=UPI003F4B5192